MNLDMYLAYRSWSMDFSPALTRRLRHGFQVPACSCEGRKTSKNYKVKLGWRKRLEMKTKVDAGHLPQSRYTSIFFSCGGMVGVVVGAMNQSTVGGVVEISCPQMCKTLLLYTR